MTDQAGVDEPKANPNPGPSIVHSYDCTHDPCQCEPQVETALLLTQQEWDDLAEMVRVHGYDHRTVVFDPAEVPVVVRRRELAQRIIEANQP